MADRGKFFFEELNKMAKTKLVYAATSMRTSPGARDTECTTNQWCTEGLLSGAGVAKTLYRQVWSKIFNHNVRITI